MFLQSMPDDHVVSLSPQFIISHFFCGDYYGNLGEVFGWHITDAHRSDVTSTIDHYDYDNYFLLGRPEDISIVTSLEDELDTVTHGVWFMHSTWRSDVIYDDKTFIFSSRVVTMQCVSS